MTNHYFKLKPHFKPKGDQISAIKKLNDNFITKKEQVLLGVTGSGKTFTMANVIEKLQKKTLILVQNKTLAGQLYNEFKSFFPENKVEYFISNFDYYQPEAFLPSKNIYIDKTAKQNSEINRFRLSTYNSLTSRNDTIVVASVAAIFGSFSPINYVNLSFKIKKNQEIKRIILIKKLIKSGYHRNDWEIKSGCFCVKGDVINIMFSSENEIYYKIDLLDEKIQSIIQYNILVDKALNDYDDLLIFPGSDFIYDKKQLKKSIKRIKDELQVRLNYFDKKKRILERTRLKERVEQDLENLSEFGITNGIENYSRHLELREEGDPPSTLINYFGDDWLLIIDESHITIPQIYGMYNADRSRKEVLVDYGFRLPSALDNRPLNFKEFISSISKAMYVSATPADFEINRVKNNLVEQIIRPTGLLDPLIYIESKKNQIFRILNIIRETIKENERIIILTLTMKMAEELAHFLEERKIKSAYLHSKLKSLERLIVLNSLRRGEIDCLVGINLLREGIDLPEVSTIIIIDGDIDGFLRNYKSLIQIIGRATRNVNGKVYIFADKMTKSMKLAISVTKKRREIQIAHNKKNNIKPKGIIKPIFHIKEEDSLREKIFKKGKLSLSKKQKKKIVNEMKTKMLTAAKNLDFETAAKYRDLIYKISI